MHVRHAHAGVKLIVQAELCVGKTASIYIGMHAWWWQSGSNIPLSGARVPSWQSEGIQGLIVPLLMERRFQRGATCHPYKRVTCDCRRPNQPRCNEE